MLLGAGAKAPAYLRSKARVHLSEAKTLRICHSLLVIKENIASDICGLSETLGIAWRTETADIAMRYPRDFY